MESPHKSTSEAEKPQNYPTENTKPTERSQETPEDTRQITTPTGEEEGKNKGREEAEQEKEPDTAAAPSESEIPPAVQEFILSYSPETGTYLDREGIKYINELLLGIQNTQEQPE